METPQRKINEKSEYSILHDEEFILLTDSRLIKDSLFCTLSVIVAMGPPSLLYNEYRVFPEGKADKAWH